MGAVEVEKSGSKIDWLKKFSRKFMWVICLKLLKKHVLVCLSG